MAIVRDDDAEQAPEVVARIHQDQRGQYATAPVRCLHEAKAARQPDLRWVAPSDEPALTATS